MTGKERLASYFSDGVVWEGELVKIHKRNARIGIAIGIVGVSMTLLSLMIVSALIPLKSFEPYIVEVDKNTGFIEVKSGLTRTTNLTDQEAVTQANVVRYIKARESYDPYEIKDNVSLAALLSTGDAANDLQRLYSSDNSSNPIKTLGKSSKVRINIKSVLFPNQTTAIVRFSATTETNGSNGREDHYVSVLRFRYTDTPMKNEWRFDNPLGFQVTSYRRDQESIIEGSKK